MLYYLGLLLLLSQLHIVVSYTLPMGTVRAFHITGTLSMSSAENPFIVRNIVIPEDKLIFSYARCSGPGIVATYSTYYDVADLFG